MSRNSWKTLIIILLIILVGYVGILPQFWPEPTVEVECPQQMRIGEDVDIIVNVSAWHPLFHISRIRFVPDLQSSTAASLSNPFYPLQPFSVTAKKYGYNAMFQRFTWPITRKQTATIGLSENGISEKLRPGNLLGKIDVDFTYAEYALRTISTARASHSVPVTIEVLPAHK